MSSRGRLAAALLVALLASAEATEVATEAEPPRPVTVPDLGLESLEMSPLPARGSDDSRATAEDDSAAGAPDRDGPDAGPDDAPDDAGAQDDMPAAPTPGTAVEAHAPRPVQPHAAGETTPRAPIVEGRPAGAPVPAWGALELLGTRVAPGTRADLHWTAGQSFAGSAIDTPVVVIRGERPGPTLCLTAAVHGDELNGVEIVRRVLAGLDAGELSGTVIGVPIVNLLGFTRGSRYLPDRRDLNRYFPGHPRGSSASRIAYAFFTEVVLHCTRLVDLHTGSFKRTNLPQLRANLDDAEVRAFVERFGATSVLHKRGDRGTLREAATEAGIPAVTFELGEPATLQLRQVEFGVKALDTLLDKLGMVRRFRLWAEPQPIFYRSRWLRAFRGGILTSNLRVGAEIAEGQLLGEVINPLTNERSEIRSPYSGHLLGRALNQFVLPGFATFHIGIAADAEGAAVATPLPADADLDEEMLPADGYAEDGEDSEDGAYADTPAAVDASMPGDEERFEDLGEDEVH
ncbi:MAG: succinylglutamate desuccinylase/aspartoacylase family protein [Gammaproteobacteria bacterium]